MTAVTTVGSRAQAEMARAVLCCAERTPDVLRYSAGLETGYQQPATAVRSQADSIQLTSAEQTPTELGAKLLAQSALRSGCASPKRRGRATDQAGRTAGATDGRLTGESLHAELPQRGLGAGAEAQIGPEHVRIIEKFFDDLPGHIDGQLAI